jgi:hypothetical protein
MYEMTILPSIAVGFMCQLHLLLPSRVVSGLHGRHEMSARSKLVHLVSPASSTVANTSC